MKWLARLKQTEMTCKPDPTKTTKSDFVVSVGSVPVRIQKNDGCSAAANDASIEVQANSAENHMARLMRFTDKGLDLLEADILANKLTMRDSELDDRHVCLECLHLSGHSVGAWRCSNWQQAAIALNANDAVLPRDLAMLLQRCDGFKAQHQSRITT